ncbi:MAG: cytochrome C [Rubellimicrobium sp.]|nr:cytochrome C [Rubellimicrobium sp.]
MSGHHRLAIATLAVALGPLSALAGPGDADGAALAVACFSCHGPEGRGGGEIPALAGRDAGEIARQLSGYADGSIPGTIMPRLAPSYTGAEVTALADWFAEVAP